MIIVLLGVISITAFFAIGFLLWKMYQRIGIVSTFLFAGAVPFMIIGILTALSNIQLSVENNKIQGALDWTIMQSTPLIIGIGMIVLELIWSLGRVFVINCKRKNNLNGVDFEPKDSVSTTDGDNLNH